MHCISIPNDVAVSKSVLHFFLSEGAEMFSPAGEKTNLLSLRREIYGETSQTENNVMRLEEL